LQSAIIQRSACGVTILSRWPAEQYHTNCLPATDAVGTTRIQAQRIETYLTYQAIPIMKQYHDHIS
jgi:hypothetical protein